MRACCLIREAPHYRREAFVAGLSSLGYRVEHRARFEPGPEDLLVIWNRYGANHGLAASWERRGAKVIIAENGYLGADEQGRQFYALALSGHNGSGQWFPAGPERWAALGLSIAPWRHDGRHILVCGQRGIGSPSMASPKGWHDGAAKRLARLSDMPIRLRLHPGLNRPGRPVTTVPLEQDLAGCFAVVCWSSSVAGKALLRGIPAFVEAPHHVLDGAVERDLLRIGDPARPERLPAFERMAWAQWSVEEIGHGEPFRHLLRRT